MIFCHHAVANTGNRASCPVLRSWPRGRPFYLRLPFRDLRLPLLCPCLGRLRGGLHLLGLLGLQGLHVGRLRGFRFRGLSLQCLRLSGPALLIPSRLRRSKGISFSSGKSIRLDLERSPNCVLSHCISGATGRACCCSNQEGSLYGLGVCFIV